MSNPPPEPSAAGIRPRLDVGALLSEALERQMRRGASFRSLTVDALAREAGISRSSFYLHFRDKTALLAHLLNRVADEIGHAAGGWFTHPEHTGPEEIARAVAGIVEVFERHRAPMQAAIESAGQDDAIDALYRSTLRGLLRINRRVIQRAAAAGRTHRKLSPEVGDALLWMVERCSYQFARGGLDAGQRQRIVDAMAHIVWHSLFQSPDPRAG